MTSYPPARRLEHMPLADIAPAARNPKGHDLSGIGRSMKTLGYVEPVVLDERTGRLVAGHGRVQALRSAHAAGDPAPDGIALTGDGAWLVPVLRGWASRSDDEADAYLIAANRLTEAGGWDDHGLAEILAELADAQLLDVTGYTGDDLDDLIAVLQEDPPLPAPGHPDAGQPGAPAPAAAAEQRDPLAAQSYQSRGLADLKDDYAASNSRLLVLSYPGDTYVWIVKALAGLMGELDVDTNTDVVLALVERAAGETAPRQP